MRAMVIREFGGVEVFEERDVDRPEPWPTEVLVRVHATSVNPVDAKIREAGEWAGVEPPAVIGYDVSGVVEEAGEAVTDFEPGDEVYYTPEIDGTGGSYAEYHAVDESIVARKPPSLSHTEAAALPLAGGTAYEAVYARGDASAGETVLVHGAGGVGAHAVQMAAAAGALVVAVTSLETVEQTEDLGAVRAVSYDEDFVEEFEAALDEPVDLAFSTVGGETVDASTPLVRRHGRLVTILPPDGEWSEAYQKNLTLHLVFLERQRRTLDGMRRLVERGHLQPVVDRVLSLDEVADAHELVERGGLTGKVVLDVAGE
jgi:NADPH:quinone reductase-like Zn-dependent oxidoreductase